MYVAIFIDLYYKISIQLSMVFLSFLAAPPTVDAGWGNVYISSFRVPTAKLNAMLSPSKKEPWERALV